MYYRSNRVTYKVFRWSMRGRIHPLQHISRYPLLNNHFFLKYALKRDPSFEFLRWLGKEKWSRNQNNSKLIDSAAGSKHYCGNVFRSVQNCRRLRRYQHHPDLRISLWSCSWRGEMQCRLSPR